MSVELPCRKRLLKFIELSDALDSMPIDERVRSCSSDELDDFGRFASHLLSIVYSEDIRRRGLTEVQGRLAIRQLNKVIMDAELGHWNVLDHAVVYRTSDKRHVIISAPYYFDLENFNRLCSVLKDTEWFVRISCDSQYFPGRTYRLEFLKRKEWRKELLHTLIPSVNLTPGGRTFTKGGSQMTDTKELTMKLTGKGLCLDLEGNDSVTLPDADVKQGDVILLQRTSDLQVTDSVVVEQVCHVFTYDNDPGKSEYAGKIVKCREWKS